MLMGCCWRRRTEPFERCLEGGEVSRKDEEGRVEREDDGKVVVAVVVKDELGLIETKA